MKTVHWKLSDEHQWTQSPMVTVQFAFQAAPHPKRSACRRCSSSFSRRTSTESVELIVWHCSSLIVWRTWPASCPIRAITGGSSSADQLIPCQPVSKAIANEKFGQISSNRSPPDQLKKRAFLSGSIALIKSPCDAAGTHPPGRPFSVDGCRIRNEKHEELVILVTIFHSSFSCLNVVWQTHWLTSCLETFAGSSLNSSDRLVASLSLCSVDLG